jgi:hypothetical protein
MPQLFPHATRMEGETMACPIVHFREEAPVVPCRVVRTPTCLLDGRTCHEKIELAQSSEPNLKGVSEILRYQKRRPND